MEFLSSHARWSSLIIKKQNIWNRFKFFYDKYPIFIHWRKNRVDKMTFTFSSQIPGNTWSGLYNQHIFIKFLYTRDRRTGPNQCTAKTDFGIWKCIGHFVQAITVSVNSDIVWNESAFTKMILGSRPENPDVIDSVYLRNNIQINIWYLIKLFN